jgi:2-amino-4-hydroxy-6-hydroxymethyldihydropteridine diphosphokinase
MKRNLIVALGSNLASIRGGPESTLRAAINLLKSEGATIRAISPFYHTPAFPAGSGPDFVNAVAVIRSDLMPDRMLECLHHIETELGRTREKRWGQRTLDLDLIGCDDLVLPDRQTFAHWRNLPLEAQMTHTPDQLILPHPRVQDRAFVLVPLTDVAPQWRHPVLDLTARQMCDALPQAERDKVQPV